MIYFKKKDVKLTWVDMELYPQRRRNRGFESSGDIASSATVFNNYTPASWSRNVIAASGTSATLAATAEAALNIQRQAAIAALEYELYLQERRERDSEI